MAVWVYDYSKDYLGKTIKEEKPMKYAYGYARVSTKRQEAEGYSLEAQQEQIENYCKANGYELKDMYSESMSGSNSNRPQLNEVLDLCNYQTLL